MSPTMPVEKVDVGSVHAEESMVGRKRGNVTETYISLDIEVAGPIPGVHSMIEFGCAVLMEEELDLNFKCFQRSLKGFAKNVAETYSNSWEWEDDTHRWWHHASRVGHLMDIEAAAVNPYLAIDEFATWLEQFSSKVIVSFGSDLNFLNFYWWKVFGSMPPYTWLGVDGKSFAMAALSCDFMQTKNTDLRKNYPILFRHDLPHTHRALDDAKEQAWMFSQLRRINGWRI